MEGRGRQPRQTLLWCSYQAIQLSIQPTRPYKLPHTRVRVEAGACSKLALRRFVARIYLQLSIYVPVYARNRAITAGVSRLQMPEEMFKSWPPHSLVKDKISRKKEKIEEWYRAINILHNALIKVLLIDILVWYLELRFFFFSRAILDHF